jgi:enoyl-CoA hydratase/carnithine racemase
MAAAPRAAAPVELRREGDVATIALTQPERRNVLDEAMADALREAAESLAAETVAAATAPRCVILTGSGDVFAAGADVAAIGAASAAENLAYNRRLRAAVEAVAAIPVPTVAAVNGHAVGGGLELALACTLRVGAATARYGLPEATLGILPATGGLARLPRLIGSARAARLLLTGELIDGPEAARLGILDLAVAAARVAAEAEALARRIAAAAPLATRAIVAALREDAELPLAAATERSEERLAALLESADRREGARAFLTKRRPEFRGR